MKQQELFLAPCNTWAEKLAAAHPHDLTIEERTALDQHVQTCAACAAVLADYRQMDAAILALPPVAPLAELPFALRQAFGEPAAGREQAPSPANLPRPVLLRPRPRARRWARLAGAVAAVLVVTALIGGFIFLFNAHHTLVGGAGSSLVIYVASGANDGTVYAIRPSDGAIYWQYALGQKLSGDLAASSDTVYASAGSHVYALRKSDGSLRWTSPIVPGGAFPPILVGVNAIYLSSPDALYALSLQDGHVLWSRKSQSCHAGCVAVFMAVSDGIAYAYMDGLYALRASDGHVIWHDPEFQFTTRSFVVTDGTVYVPDERKGAVYALRASDGQQLHTFTFQKDQPIEMIGALGVIYIDSGGRDVYAIHTGDNATLWHKQFDNNIILGLSAADNRGLYFAATTETVSSIEILSSPGVAAATPTVSASAASTDAYALNIADGSLRWHWHPSNNTGGSSNVLALDGHVYLSVGGSLYALSASNGIQLWVALQAPALTSPVAG
jgi:prepilin-type processing-associated H-X9-DG protein